MPIDTLIRRGPKNPILFVGINVTVLFACAGCIGAWSRAKHYKAIEGTYRVHWERWLLMDGDDIHKDSHSGEKKR